MVPLVAWFDSSSILQSSESDFSWSFKLASLPTRISFLDGKNWIRKFNAREKNNKKIESKFLTFNDQIYKLVVSVISHPFIFLGIGLEKPPVNKFYLKQIKSI